MRRLPLIALFFVALLAACGSNGESPTPTACFASPSGYLQALRGAPGEVRLDRETAISDCFGATQPVGDQAQVGQSVIKAGTTLNGTARRRPDSPQTVQLGYLVGAVEKGAQTSAGVDDDLVRRLEAAARFNPGGGSPGAAFERAFGRGYAAGQETG